MDIDYSNIPHEGKILDENWDAPRHVFFGKRGLDGKMEKEPVYSYHEFPAMMYAEINGKTTARVVNNAQEKAALGTNWKDTPAEFGIIGAPSFNESTKDKKLKAA